MSRIYIPASSAEQWAQFLAEPVKHWRQGYSARTLAYSWQEANGFPVEVHAALTSRFPGIELLLALPEHQVPLPGGSRPSQNDIWALARSEGKLISIAVEGKVSEAFGPTIGEWRTEFSPGKQERLAFLCSHSVRSLRFRTHCAISSFIARHQLSSKPRASVRLMLSCWFIRLARTANGFKTMQRSPHTSGAKRKRMPSFLLVLVRVFCFTLLGSAGMRIIFPNRAGLTSPCRRRAKTHAPDGGR